MTEKLIEEALQLIRDLESARDSTDNPILIKQYNNDIERIQKLLNILNDSLNDLIDEDK